MSGTGLVTAVDQVSAKQGEPVWQIITDAQNRSADGLNRCAVWIMHYRNGVVQAHPAIGQMVHWDGRHVSWGDPPVRVDQVDHEFAPDDPKLFTG